MKYRKKPVIVEAMTWTSQNTTEILHWMCPELPPDAEARDLTIHTLEGDLHASPGDWIIRGIKGEFYCCKPDTFAETYEPVPEATK